MFLINLLKCYVVIIMSCLQILYLLHSIDFIALMSAEDLEK